MELIYNKHSGRVKPMPLEQTNLTTDEESIEASLQEVMDHLNNILQDQRIPLQTRRDIISGFNMVVEQYTQPTGQMYAVPRSFNI